MASDEDKTADQPGIPSAVLLAWGATPTTTKGPKPRWTLDELLETAVRLGDEEGINAISMSGLAKALGSGIMSLYRYVESREDLVILAADHALGPGTTPVGDTWQERLWEWVSDLRSAYEQHPWLTATPVGTEPLLPSYLCRLETGLECLEQIGLPGERAITVLTMLWTYTRGDVEQEAHLTAVAGDQPAQINQFVAQRLRSISGDHQLSRVLAALESEPAPKVDGDEFKAAINIIVNGLVSTGNQ